MLAAAGIFLLATSVAAFFWTLRRGIYRRYPWEQLVLVGTSTALGLLAVLGEPGPFAVLAFGVELAALAGVAWYLGMGARFARGRLPLAVGELLPRIQLPDSEGGSFDSDDLLGRSSALYLFFRGDW